MTEVFEPVEHVAVWMDGGIHIKATEPNGDPVEMSEEQALALSDLLRRLVDEQR